MVDKVFRSWPWKQQPTRSSFGWFSNHVVACHRDVRCLVSTQQVHFVLVPLLLNDLDLDWYLHAQRDHGYYWHVTHNTAWPQSGVTVSNSSLIDLVN